MILTLCYKQKSYFCYFDCLPGRRKLSVIWQLWWNTLFLVDRFICRLSNLNFLNGDDNRCIWQPSNYIQSYIMLNMHIQVSLKMNYRYYEYLNESLLYFYRYRRSEMISSRRKAQSRVTEQDNWHWTAN